MRFPAAFRSWWALAALVILVMLVLHEGDPARTAGSILFGLLFVAVGLAFYFLPAIIAAHRKHRQYTPILIVNLFLGWTLVGWVVALAWAFWEDEKSSNL